MKSAVVSAERRCVRCADLLEKGTESIVNQARDDSDALIVHAEISFEFLE